MRFQPNQLHRLTAIGLKSGKKVHKLDFYGHFRDLKVNLKIH